MPLSGLLAFTIAIVVTPLVTLGLRRWRVLDIPNRRSMHQEATPRGGGLGVAIAVTLAVALGPELRGVSRASLLLCGVALASVGLLEDVVGVPALRRLPLLFAAAAVALPWTFKTLQGGYLWHLAFGVAVVVWVVSYTNAFNFMDGINGLAAGQVVVAAGAWYVIGRSQDVAWLSAMALIVGGAALGFLPWNLPRAKVFLGDVGSYFLGAILAIMAVEALRSGIPFEAVTAPLAVFVADTGMTLVRRIARGERWFEAHREHAYQRLTLQLGGSHTRGTSALTAVMAVCSALGALSLAGSLQLRLIGDFGIAAILAVYLAAPSLVERVRRRQLALA